MQVKDGPVPAGPFPLVAAHPLASWALGFFHGMRGASGANRLTGPRQKGERVHVAAEHSKMHLAAATLWRMARY